jgi:hypothetical protein
VLRAEYASPDEVKPPSRVIRFLLRFAGDKGRHVGAEQGSEAPKGVGTCLRAGFGMERPAAVSPLILRVGAGSLRPGAVSLTA